MNNCRGHSSFARHGNRSGAGFQPAVSQRFQRAESCITRYAPRLIGAPPLFTGLLLWLSLAHCLQAQLPPDIFESITNTQGGIMEAKEGDVRYQRGQTVAKA